MKVEMNNKSNIGKAFSDRFKDFSIEPAPEVWENVSSRIPTTSPNPFLSRGFLISAGAVAVLAIALFFVFQNKKQTLKSSVDLSVNNQNEVKASQEISVDKQVVDYQVDENQEPIKVSEQITKVDIKLCNDPDTSSNEVVKVNRKNINPILIDTENTGNIIDIPSKISDKTGEKIATVESDNTPSELYTEYPVALQRDSVSYSADPIICFGEDAHLKVNGGESYHWNNGDIMSGTTVQPVTNSDYSVTVTDKYRSEHIHVFHVTIDRECTAVSVPSAFTPNADGNNDIFRAYGENITSFTMQIMNRQGQLLFSSSDINQGWDGMFKGELQPAQVYVYTIVYTNGRGEQNIKKGQFTLLR